MVVRAEHEERGQRQVTAAVMAEEGRAGRGGQLGRELLEWVEGATGVYVGSRAKYAEDVLALGMVGAGVLLMCHIGADVGFPALLQPERGVPFAEQYPSFLGSGDDRGPIGLAGALGGAVGADGTAGSGLAGALAQAAVLAKEGAGNEVAVVASMVGVAALFNCMAGFGFGVVTVGLLAGMDLPTFDLVTAQAVVAILGVPLNAALFLPHRKEAEIAPLAHFLVPAVLACPVGVGLLPHVDGPIAVQALGMAIALYAAFELTRGAKGTRGGDAEGITRSEAEGQGEGVSEGEGATEGEGAAEGDGEGGAARAPRGLSLIANTGDDEVMRERALAWVFGALTGLLGGAFSMPGPAVAIYANLSGWSASPTGCRARIALLMVILRAWVAGLDAAEGRLSDPYVWECVAYCVPAATLGYLIANRLSSHVRPGEFRKWLNGMLFANGLELML